MNEAATAASAVRRYLPRAGARDHVIERAALNSLARADLRVDALPEARLAQKG